MRTLVRTRLRLISLASLLCALPALAQDAPTAVFVVRGLRNDRGFLAGGIYADRNVWTREGGQVATCRVPIHDGTARCVIQAPGPGTYAFAFMHDEDGNGRMNTDSLGLPQEGYGFGHDAHGTLGAPSFESAAYSLDVGLRIEQTVTARYGLGL
jgi:uncharacterized protein (DUF2141 family)